MHSGPQVHDSQVQLGFSHPEAGWAQLQSDPQVQGEQLQLGFSHFVSLVMR